MRLAGEITSSLGNPTNLKTLDLNFNGLSGEIPPSLGNLIWLDELYLCFNQLAGEIPSSIGNLTNLRTLYLSSNRLSGEIPSSLEILIWLDELYLSFNQLASEIPSSLGNLTSFISLTLGSNYLTGVARLDLLLELKGITDVELSSNASVAQLDFLYLDSLDLKEVPGFLQQPNKLDMLTLSKNNISGRRPQWLLEKTINFIGTIPETVGDNLLKLHTLILSNNHFSGPIPLSLEKLRRLEALNLSRNKLYGEIPTMLTRVTSLEILNVSYNNLSSPIPIGNQFSTFENTSYIGNPELCSSPLTKKCGNPLQPSSSLAHNQEQKLSLTLGVAWITAGIGLAGGFIVGVALEQAFGNDVLDWLARKWHKVSKKYSLR